MTAPDEQHPADRWLTQTWPGRITYAIVGIAILAAVGYVAYYLLIAVLVLAALVLIPAGFAALMTRLGRR